MHNRPSLLKIGVFLFAIFVNLYYFQFIINFSHADTLWFFCLAALADTIVIIVFVSTWFTALYAEIFKQSYNSEVRELRFIGKDLLRERVAVLVPTVNEPLEVLEATLESLLALKGNKRVYVLDDGRHQETRSLCRNLGVEYLARPDKSFAKAGNQNFGFRHVTEEFVVMVDADFSLHPEFIERTLPLFADPTVALVQTPQVYCNVDTPIAQGAQNLQEVFYSSVLPGKHLNDSAFFVGTNAICRRSAMEKIGFIREIDHSEDMFTAVRLMEYGFRVFYLNENLAVGLSPSSVIACFNQQFRWARGGIYMMLKHNTLFNKKLHVTQRIQFFFSNFFYLRGISIMIYLLSPLIAILGSVKPVNDTFFYEWLIRYTLFMGTNLLLDMTFIKKYRLQTMQLALFNFIPYVAALWTEIFGFKIKWKVTGGKSKGLENAILFPILLYIFLGIATIYLLITHVIALNPGYLHYYFWLMLNMCLFIPFVISAYVAKPQLVIPDVRDFYGLADMNMHDIVDRQIHEILEWEEEDHFLFPVSPDTPIPGSLSDETDVQYLSASTGISTETEGYPVASPVIHVSQSSNHVGKRSQRRRKRAMQKS